MHTVRNLAAALACTALLSVVGVTAAGAEDHPNCARLARTTERIEAKKAKVADRRARFNARLQEHPRATEWVQQHQARFDTAIARIETKAAKALQGCST